MRDSLVHRNAICPVFLLKLQVILLAAELILLKLQVILLAAELIFLKVR